MRACPPPRRVRPSPDSHFSASPAHRRSFDAEATAAELKKLATRNRWPKGRRQELHAILDDLRRPAYRVPTAVTEAFRRTFQSQLSLSSADELYTAAGLARGA